MSSTTDRLNAQAALAFMVGQSARRQNFDVTYNVLVTKSSGIGSSTGTGCALWDKFVVRVAHEIDFYRSLPDGDPHIASATADCAMCDGQGTVRNTRTRIRYATKVCPACKGKNTSRDVLPELLLALNALVAHTTPAERAERYERDMGWAA